MFKYILILNYVMLDICIVEMLPSVDGREWWVEVDSTKIWSSIIMDLFKTHSLHYTVVIHINACN